MILTPQARKGHIIQNGLSPVTRTARCRVGRVSVSGSSVPLLAAARLDPPVQAALGAWSHCLRVQGASEIPPAFNRGQEAVPARAKQSQTVLLLQVTFRL